MPHAGGQYVYLREAYGPLSGFLYGWTLFLVIQTGTIAAVAVAFAEISRPASPRLDSRRNLSANGAVRLNPAVGRHPELVLLSSQHARDSHGELVQNVFTLAKTLRSWDSSAWFSALRTQRGRLQRLLDAHGGGRPTGPDARARIVFVAMVVGCSPPMPGRTSLTPPRGAEPAPQIPLSLAFGTGLVTLLYLVVRTSLLCLSPLAPTCRGGPGGHARRFKRLGGRGRGHHGGCNHGVHLRLRQRDDPGRRPRILRNGPRRPVLPRRRACWICATTGIRAGNRMRGRCC